MEKIPTEGTVLVASSQTKKNSAVFLDDIMHVSVLVKMYHQKFHSD